MNHDGCEPSKYHGHSNEHKKIEFLLENGRHRFTKMWHCRRQHTLMLQHLDA
jgi:hypothetical protein